jgi:hypothetical protein
MLRVRSLRGFVATAAIAITAFGCNSVDGPIAPQQQAASAPASSSLLGSLLGTATTTTIDPVLRTTPLAMPVNVSRTIGVLGGAFSVPGTGLTVIVPALAVSTPTVFSVTALAGSAIAYDFGPHGRFNVPVVLTQDLHNTQVAAGLVNPLSLRLGYFPDANNITSVSEILNVGVSVQSLVAVAAVWHFSGYIFAGGYSDDQ